jgi:flagellar hook-associated protein 3 FlgL
MTISTNLYFDRSSAQFGALQTRVDKLQTEISTGKKLNAPSDDAVGYQRLQGLVRGTADDKAWSANIGLAQTLLQQTDTALGGISDRLQQVQELAVQATNGTLSADNRKILAGQVRSVLDDLVGLANTKDVRGTPLFGAATGDTAVTVDASGNVSFTGTGNPPPIPIGDGVTVAPTESAARVFDGIPTATGTTDTFTLLNNFATALESGAPVPTSYLDSLQAAGDQVANVRGAAGARSARLDLESSRVQATGVARTTEQSAIEDTDVTATIAELQKTSTVLQATQASFSKFSQLSLFDYLR